MEPKTKLGVIDSGRAKDSPASLLAFTHLGRSADPSISSSRSRAGVAKNFLLDMSCPALRGIRGKTAQRSTASFLADRLARIYVRHFLVSRELLLDLSDDAPLRESP
jgi:hypothetical protein